jgi:hypothetical protein
MTGSDRWPPVPRDRILHGWRCTRSEPVTESVVTLPTGQARVVRTCGECGGTDETHDYDLLQPY